MSLIQLFAAIGPLLFIGGVVHLLVARSIRGRRTKVTGAIIGWNHSGAGTNVSTPTVQFTTRDGQEITRNLSGSVDIGIYREKPVPVWYDPDNPERFSTETPFLGKPGVFLIGLSLPVMLISWFVLGGLG